MRAYDKEKSLDELKALSSHEKIKESVDSSNLNNAEKKKVLIAATYYQVVESRKGEHAFYLEKQLRENLSKTDDRVDFLVPPYIIDSINFITTLDIWKI